MAKDIEDPEAKVSVWKSMQSRRIAEPSGGGRGSAATPADRAEARVRPDLRIGALGSGSDYTAFLDHLGIASMNLGFGGEDGSGIYHSIYDDFYWYTHFGDTHFVYGRALAQTGTAVVRLADAELLPFDFDDFNDTIRRYIEEVQTLAKEKRDQVIERNRQIDEGLFAALENPREKTVPPQKETVPPFLDFAPLQNGLAALERTTADFNRTLARASENGGAALARGVERRQRPADGHRAGADGERRHPQPSVVSAYDLRPGVLYGLRREDAAGGAREYRAEAVDAGKRADRARREGAGEYGGGDRGGFGGTGAGGEVGNTILHPQAVGLSRGVNRIIGRALLRRPVPSTKQDRPTRSTADPPQAHSK